MTFSRANESWYRCWRHWHTVIAVGITLLITVFYLLFSKSQTLGFNSAPSSIEILSMTCAVAFFGVPHGATDHLVASDIFKGPFPRTWLIVFVLVYLMLMGAVILAWILLPSMSLAVFLLLTIVHWGLGDVEDDLVPSRLRPAAVFLSSFVSRGLEMSAPSPGAGARRYSNRTALCCFSPTSRCDLHMASCSRKLHSASRSHLGGSVGRHGLGRNAG